MNAIANPSNYNLLPLSRAFPPSVPKPCRAAGWPHVECLTRDSGGHDNNVRVALEVGILMQVVRKCDVARELVVLHGNWLACADNLIVQVDNVVVTVLVPGCLGQTMSAFKPDDI